MKEYFKKFEVALTEANEWEKKNPGWKAIPKYCKFCHTFHMCKVPMDEWKAYEKNPNQNIQNVLKNVSIGDREIFISQVCPDCWEKTFGKVCDKENDRDE